MQTQMAMMAGMGQLSSAVSGATGGGGGGDSQSWLPDCSGAGSLLQEEDLFSEEECETDEVKRILFLCVHSGSDLPQDMCFPRITVNKGTDFESVHEDPTVCRDRTGTQFCWAWTCKTEITFTSGAEFIDISVLGKRALGFHKFLGTATLRLRSTLGDPTRQVCSVTLDPAVQLGHRMSNLLSKPKAPKIVVVWQILKDTVVLPPPLRAIAELGERGVAKRRWKLNVKVFGVGMAHLQDDGPLTVTMNIHRPNSGHHTEELATPALAMTKTEAKQFIGTFGDEDDYGFEFTPQESTESRATLMLKVLEVKVYQQTKDGPPQCLCSWHETLFNIRTSLEADGKLLADAILATSGGRDAVLGIVRLELDLYTDSEHDDKPLGEHFRQRFVRALERYTRPVSSGESTLYATYALDPEPRVFVPLRGMPRTSLWTKLKTYQVLCFADGLVLPPGATTISPFIKVTLGSCESASEVIEQQANNVQFQSAVEVAETAVERTAKIEVFDSASGSLLQSSKELLCSATINDVRMGGEYWLHCVGGAVNAPNKHEADLMNEGKGGMTGSTYRGTVVVSFGQKRTAPDDYFKKLKQRRIPAYLCVRLYGGCLFGHLRGQQVRVVVQVAGCRLPDRTIVDAMPAWGEPKPRGFMRNLLVFWGRIDAGGVLHFGDDEAPYVELETPQEIPLLVPPNALCAHIYVVAEGKEKSPPAIYGTIPFNREMKPEWRMQRFDPSVADEEQAGCMVAGFVFGCAALRPAPAVEDAVQMQISPEVQGKLNPETYQCCGFTHITGLGYDGNEVQVPPDLVRQPVPMFLHLDLLAARNLPCKDADGCDPVYTVEVGDKMYEETESCGHTVHPTFLHRIIIPVHGLIVGDSLHVPPIVLTISDSSAGGGFWEKKRSGRIGQVVVRDAKVLKPRAKGVVDVNTLHTPRWYLLGGSATAKFNPAVMAGVDPAWDKRPRVLLAAAFSTVAAVPGVSNDVASDMPPDGVRVPLVTTDNEAYRVTINLLGIRNLPPGIHCAQLKVCCETTPPQPVTLKLDEYAVDPNFLGEKNSDYKEFAKKVHRLVKFHEEGEDAAEEGEEHHPFGQQRVPLSTLVGERIAVPPFQVPVIDYLQPAPGGATAIEGQPYVILPSMSFALRGRGHEYGDAAITLGILFTSGGRPFNRDWIELTADELGDVPENIARAEVISAPSDPFKAALPGDEFYEVFIDVFSSASGHLLFDDAVELGRVLSSNHLFDVVPDESLVTFFSADMVHELRETATKTMHFFNPHDDLAFDSTRMGEAYDTKVRPAWTCGDRSLQKHQLPIAATKLFSGATGSVVDTDGRKLRLSELVRTKNTSELSLGMAAAGWRAVTHLAAPEPELTDWKFASRAMKFGGGRLKPQLAQNEHTFMRKVGHVVEKDDRDSKILARLRLRPPSKPADYGLAQTADDTCRNFLVIKFNREGTVIWTRPEESITFDRPGMPIMAVELENAQIVVIKLPCCDLRRPEENRWAVTKTLRRRPIVRKGCFIQHSDAWKRHQAASTGKHRASARRSSHSSDPEAARQKAEELADYTRAMRELDRNTFVESHLTNGVDEPVYVHENAFVMRITRGRYSQGFERSSTRNWYATVCQDMFPELAELDSELVDRESFQAKERIKEFINARLLNLRLPISWHDDSYASPFGATNIKGHVRCLRLEPRKKDSGPLPGSDKPPEQGILPVENLWKPVNVSVRVNVLTVHNIREDPTGLWYVKVKLGDQEQTDEVVDVTGMSRSSVCLYRNARFEATLPGASALTIEVWQQGLMGDELVGRSVLDVEDRWLVMQVRDLRAKSQKQFLDDVVWPTAPRKCEMQEGPPMNMTEADEAAQARASQRASRRSTARNEYFFEGKKMMQSGQACAPRAVVELDPAVEGGRLFEPMRPPPEDLPIEILDLMGESDGGAGAQVGRIRVLLGMVQEDMLPDAEVDAALDIHDASTHEYEVRVRVHDVQNIQVYKDMERNDARCQVSFISEDTRGRKITRNVSTDAHKFAVEKASFKFGWTFKAFTPSKRCALRFALTDDDMVTSSDEIYEPRTLALDDHLHFADDRRRRGTISAGRFEQTIVFNRWEGMYEEDSCRVRCFKRCCFCCFIPAKRRKQRFAELKVDIEILPVEEAARHPMEDGVQFGSPEERLNYRAAILQPISTLKMLLGPTALRRLKCFGFCVLPAIIFVAVVVLCLQPLQKLLDIEKKLADQAAGH